MLTKVNPKEKISTQLRTSNPQNDSEFETDNSYKPISTFQN